MQVQFSKANPYKATGETLLLEFSANMSIDRVFSAAIVKTFTLEKIAGRII